MADRGWSFCRDAQRDGPKPPTDIFGLERKLD